MNINIYYGGRGLIGDPTLYVIEKMQEVLALGMPVILCPNSHFYFDYPQTPQDAAPGEHVITTEVVRSFRVPELPHVLGNVNELKIYKYLFKISFFNALA